MPVLATVSDFPWGLRYLVFEDMGLGSSGLMNGGCSSALHFAAIAGDNQLFFLCYTHFSVISTFCREAWAHGTVILLKENPNESLREHTICEDY